VLRAVCGEQQRLGAWRDVGGTLVHAVQQQLANGLA